MICCRRRLSLFYQFYKGKRVFKNTLFLSRAVEYRSPISMLLNRSTQLEITADQSPLAGHITNLIYSVGIFGDSLCHGRFKYR